MPDMTTENIIVAILAGICGFVLGLVFSAIRNLLKAWKQRRSVKWMKDGDVDEMARMAEQGKLLLPYEFRQILNKIARSIDLDEGEDAAALNACLADNIMTLSGTSKRKKKDEIDISQYE